MHPTPCYLIAVSICSESRQEAIYLQVWWHKLLWWELWRWWPYYGLGTICTGPYLPSPTSSDWINRLIPTAVASQLHQTIWSAQNRVIQCLHPVQLRPDNLQFLGVLVYRSRRISSWDLEGQQCSSFQLQNIFEQEILLLSPMCKSRHARLLVPTAAELCC